MAWTMSFRYIRCGSTGCKTCNLFDGHGPYWYGHERQPGGKVKSKYFGRKYPPADIVERGYRQPVPNYSKPEPTPIADRWSRGKRMDYNTALRIMDFSRTPSRAVLQMRYRELMLEHHPDHGGDGRIAVAVNLAYAYLNL